MVEVESYKIKTQMAIANPEMMKTLFEEKPEEFQDYEEIEEIDLDDPNASYSEQAVDEMLNALGNFGFFIGSSDG